LTTLVPLKGVKRYFEKKTGKWYNYHRKTGRRIMAEFRTAAFFVELDMIEAESKSTETKKGTLGALLESYRRSSGFTDLRPRTKADYNKVMDYLKPLAPSPLAELSRRWVATLREKAYAKHKRRFANYVMQVLSIAFEHGIEQEMLTVNPVAKVKHVRRPKSMPDANRPWSKAECDAVMAEAPIQLRVPIALAMYTGLREGDALTLTWASYANGEISTTTSKAGTRIWWKCPTKLNEALADALRGDAVQVCLNSRSQPWTESGFRASWRTFRQRLEREGKVQAGLTIHGLRHTVATMLREEGFDTRTIADALGQKSTAMAEHYSKGANLTKNMVAVGEAVERAANGTGTKAV
jgi:integrase